MKKIALTVLVLCGFFFASQAQTSDKTATSSTNTGVTVQTGNLQVSLADNNPTAANVKDQNGNPKDNVTSPMQEKKQNKKQNKNQTNDPMKKRPTWQYIAAGAFVALVVVILIATGGQGYSSR